MSEQKSFQGTRTLQINTKGRKDKKNVWMTGIISLSNMVVIVDHSHDVLKLFDKKGMLISSTKLRAATWGISSVSDQKFVTCGDGKIIYLWRLRWKKIIRDSNCLCIQKSYNVAHYAHGIDYNGLYFCVLHRWNSAITILDQEGQHVRKIVKKEAFDTDLVFGWDIHMDRQTNNLYLPCDDLGVLCVSMEGESLWLASIPSSRTLGGITEMHGSLCLTNFWGHCAELVSKDGTYRGKLLENESLQTPKCVCFDEEERVLYISHSVVSEDLFSSFAITPCDVIREIT